jgi:hypothetical protein
MKPLNKMMEGREAERKACKVKMRADWEADRKKEKPTSRRGRSRGKATEKKLRQGRKPFTIRQTPTR